MSNLKNDSENFPDFAVFPDLREVLFAQSSNIRLRVHLLRESL